MSDDNDLMPEEFEIETAGDAFSMIELTMDRLLDTGSVDMVYGVPIEHGDTLIIPCSESLTVLGMGAGSGYGRGPTKPGEAGNENAETSEGEGAGGGGGGGGRTFARPVAVIVASPEGVRVEPIVDVTKLALAALTAVGMMGTFMFRMSSSRRALRSLRGSEPL
jgi:uncharacterized spore protein YtfJ